MTTKSAEVKQVWESSDGKGNIIVERLCNSGLKVTAIYQGKRVQDACCWPQTPKSSRVTNMLTHDCLVPISSPLDRVVGYIIKRAKNLIECKIADNAKAVVQQAVFEEQTEEFWEKMI